MVGANQAAGTRRISRRRACVMSVLLAALVTGRADAGVARIVAFGDSLSDAGNVYEVLGIPGPPYYEGHWTNGPVWVEVLAQLLRAPVPLPSLAGGTNYAYGGAKTGYGSSLGILDMGLQVSAYLKDGPPPAPGDLFVLFGGANDLRGGETDPAVPVANLVAHLTALHGAGAAEFLVANLPMIGQAPAHLGTPDEAILDQLAAEFNALYDAALDDLEGALAITIRRVDVHDLFADILAAPASFGFLNVTEPAVDVVTGEVVPEPDTYLFWDNLHPTRVAHARAGERAFALFRAAGDVDGDGDADFADLLAVLSAWGPCGLPCPADLDGDAAVGFADLLVVLSSW
jgi:phospholipase/lecithinase/hemolysin